MKWVLIVLIFNYKGGMVEKTFDMPSEAACNIVSLSVKEDIRKSVALEGGEGDIDLVNTCTEVPK
jgi:hypothetical protein